MEKIDIVIPTNRSKTEMEGVIQELDRNTPEPHRTICTCQPLSAAGNRNFGLSYANSSVIVMLDDDIRGFTPGWLEDFIEPFSLFPDVILVSARLLGPDGKPNNNMGMTETSQDVDYAIIKPSYVLDGIPYRRVTTAAIAFRKNDVRFDEEFRGSGYEDTAFMNEISRAFPLMTFMVNNLVKLIHMNAMVGQGDEAVWRHNHDHYVQKYPWDKVAIAQKWWGRKG